MPSEKRILVVGGGHNGLVAAILAAQAGYSVTLLEASDHLGGASVGQRLFAGRSARSSRYSYLVSLLPVELPTRLGVDLPLASRAISSYTPLRRGGRPVGLLVERNPGSATENSFRDLTGSNDEYRGWQQLYHELAAMAGVLAGVLTGPLRRRREVRDAVVAAAGHQIWDDVMERPIGDMIGRRLRDDAVRGVVATDALIGTHASLFDDSLLANRCFLYHLIGRGTGEWLVPVGGMGALADALAARARQVGVQIEVNTPIVSVFEHNNGVMATGADGRERPADQLLAAVAPAVVDSWLGRAGTAPVGSQLKINMLVDRLPRLASGADPRMVFAGTAHLGEGFDELERAYRTSAAGGMPDPIPAEVYCHSITDPSILNGQGGATLTLFGLHTPDRLFTADPAGSRELAAQRALAALQHHLAEPLQDCLARDALGELCLDVASPLDLQHALRMPGGNIFHGDLSWPWLEDDESADTPAARFGVQVPGCSRILLAGAGTRRGGGVSGLGGVAAVDALLASRRF